MADKCLFCEESKTKVKKIKLAGNFLGPTIDECLLFIIAMVSRNKILAHDDNEVEEEDSILEDIQNTMEDVKKKKNGTQKRESVDREDSCNAVLKMADMPHKHVFRVLPRKKEDDMEDCKPEGSNKKLVKEESVPATNPNNVACYRFGMPETSNYFAYPSERYYATERKCSKAEKLNRDGSNSSSRSRSRSDRRDHYYVVSR